MACLMIEKRGDFHCLALAPSPFMYFCPEVLTVAGKHTAVSVKGTEYQIRNELRFGDGSLRAEEEFLLAVIVL